MIFFLVHRKEREKIIYIISAKAKKEEFPMANQDITTITKTEKQRNVKVAVGILSKKE